MVRIVLLTLLVLTTAAAATAAGYELLRTKTITVRVGGLDEKVNEGTTLEEAAERLGIRPDAGDLLDVEHAVLQRNAFPGKLLLNGTARPRTTELEEGDRIAAVDGRDQRDLAGDLPLLELLPARRPRESELRVRRHPP